MKTLRLKNGREIPAIGFGTYMITDPVVAEEAVINALRVGYRHIDTAQLYMNEEAVGKGIAKSGINREEIFVTTKIWVENVTYEGVKKSFESSLKKLGLDYVDLLLIHQPMNDIYGAWKAMNELVEEGKVRTIGVSNFRYERLLDLSLFTGEKPAVDQIEINPFFQRTEEIKKLQEDGIVVEGWAPLAEGKNNIFQNPILLEIAKKHNKSVAQVILRWLVQQDVVVLVKSINKDRMVENFNIFDFELSSDDLNKIKTLDTKHSLIFTPTDPDFIRWAFSYKL